MDSTALRAMFPHLNLVQSRSHTLDKHHFGGLSGHVLSRKSWRFQNPCESAFGSLAQRIPCNRGVQKGLEHELQAGVFLPTGKCGEIIPLVAKTQNSAVLRAEIPQESGIEK